MTTFVQIHALRDYGPSLPNRGADGLAKRCHYGDAERQRISSHTDTCQPKPAHAKH